MQRFNKHYVFTMLWCYFILSLCICHNYRQDNRLLKQQIEAKTKDLDNEPIYDFTQRPYNQTTYKGD